MDPTAIPVPMLMGRIMGQIRNEVESAFEESGIPITMMQFGILNVLSDQNEMVLNDLAKWANRDKSSMQRQMDQLEKRRLVVRTTDLKDKRKKVLLVTKKGAEQLQDAIKIIKEIEVRMLQNIPQTEQTMLRKLLFSMLGNLNQNK